MTGRAPQGSFEDLVGPALKWGLWEARKLGHLSSLTSQSLLKGYSCGEGKSVPNHLWLSLCIQQSRFQQPEGSPTKTHSWLSGLSSTSVAVAHEHGKGIQSDVQSPGCFCCRAVPLTKRLCSSDGVVELSYMRNKFLWTVSRMADDKTNLYKLECLVGGVGVVGDILSQKL